MPAGKLRKQRASVSDDDCDLLDLVSETSGGSDADLPDDDDDDLFDPPDIAGEHATPWRARKCPRVAAHGGALRATSGAAAAVVVVNLYAPGCDYRTLPHMSARDCDMLTAAAEVAYPEPDMLTALTALGMRVAAAGTPGATRVRIPAVVVPCLPSAALRVFVLDCTASIADSASENSPSTGSE